VELEQRVKTLEYEIKILKNEIQKTLLEIQEQVLNHYYPDLRTADPAPPADTSRPVEAERRKPPSVPVAEILPQAPVERQKLPSTSAAEVSSEMEPGKLPGAPAASIVPEAPVETSSPAPVVRQVSLNEIRAAQERSAPVPTGRPATMGKLIEWALNAGSKIGNPRTKKIIEVLSSKGVLEPETMEVLLQVTPLNRRHPPEEVGVMDIMRVILNLYALLGREAEVEETFALMKEANLG
jgi:hypothetical protein